MNVPMPVTTAPEKHEIQDNHQAPQQNGQFQYQPAQHLMNQYQTHPAQHVTHIDSIAPSPFNATQVPASKFLSLESLAVELDIPKLMEASSLKDILAMDFKKLKEDLGLTSDEYIRIKKYKTGLIIPAVSATVL
jgi:hypothetical protein